MNLNKIKSINDELIKSQQNRSTILIDLMMYILQNPVIDTHLLQDYYMKFAPEPEPEPIIQNNISQTKVITPVINNINNIDSSRERVLNLYAKRINNNNNNNISCNTCSTSSFTNQNRQVQLNNAVVAQQINKPNNMQNKIEAEMTQKTIMQQMMQQNIMEQNNALMQQSKKIQECYTDTKEFKDFVILHNNIGNINITYKIGKVTEIKISVTNNKVNYILS